MQKGEDILLKEEMDATFKKEETGSYKGEREEDEGEDVTLD